jgi:hypothetical protein
MNRDAAPPVGLADGFALVAAEVVDDADDDDVAWSQRGDKDLLDIGKASPLIGPLITHGASIRSERSAARKVRVCQRV